MNTEKYKLLHFFRELVDYALMCPGRPGFGNPCKHLISDLIMRQDTFIQKILDNDGEFVEYRLNGAGLKIHWRMGDGQFQCYIAGDQVRDYPDFMHKAEMLIRSFNFIHR